MPTPRTNAQRFLLTWSQANDIDADELADFLHALDDDNWVELCQEEHTVQGIHYHAVVVFPDRFQKPLTVFDFGGRTADIQPIKNGTTDLTRARHYLRKGNRPKEEEHDIKTHKKTPCDYSAEVLDRGEVPEYSTETGRLSWGEILVAAQSIDEFLLLAERHRTADFVLRHQNLRDFAAYRWSERPANYIPEWPRETYTVPAALDDWVNEVFREVSFLSYARLHERAFLIEY